MRPDIYRTKSFYEQELIRVYGWLKAKPLIKKYRKLIDKNCEDKNIIKLKTK